MFVIVLKYQIVEFVCVLFNGVPLIVDVHFARVFLPSRVPQFQTHEGIADSPPFVIPVKWKRLNKIFIYKKSS